MLDRLRELAKTLKREVGVYRRVLRHPRTPWTAKVLLGLALGYLLLPFDLIPDFLPVVGQLDDLVIVPGLIWLAVKLVPAEVMAECRRDEDEDEWRKGVAAVLMADWSDPREDIYTEADGEPIDPRQGDGGA